MRTRKTEVKITVRLINREEDKIWNQIGLSKFKFKLRVKNYNLKPHK